MPSLLRRNTIRLLEASLDAHHLAISSLGATKRISYRDPRAQYAPEMGLIGTATELAMSACLVQAGGNKALVISSNQHFKSFSQIRSEFRALLNNTPPSSDFLFQDVDDVANHKRQLLSHTEQFARLGVARASGLHGGFGLIHETVVFQANIVSEFFEILAKSGRLRPYLENIPNCLLYSQDRSVIIEDLVRRLDEDEQDKDTLLRSLYLVLPDLPDNEPDWLQALNRVSVAPRKNDITYLITTMQNALPSNLRRTSGSGQGISVSVRPQDPNALPIEPQYLRTQFNQIRDRWYADIGTANGRLNEGLLDLPPAVAVRDVFSVGLYEAGVLEDNESLTAHQAWPFIATSLNTQTRTTTPGPYWFIVKHCDDLGQLRALLNRAKEIGRTGLRHHAEEFFIGIDAILNNEHIHHSHERFHPLLQAITLADEKREQISVTLDRSKNTPKELPNELMERLEGASEGEFAIGLLAQEIYDGDFAPEIKRYWTSTLSQCANDLEDISILTQLLQDKSYKAVWTVVRKAIRRIDFRIFGPPIQPQASR